MHEIDLRRVGFLNGAAKDDCLRRIVEAAGRDGVSTGALRALAQLTAAALRIPNGLPGGLPDQFHWADLAELEERGLIRRNSTDTEIYLV